MSSLSLSPLEDVFIEWCCDDGPGAEVDADVEAEAEDGA